MLTWLTANMKYAGSTEIALKNSTVFLQAKRGQSHTPIFPLFLNSSMKCYRLFDLALLLHIANCFSNPTVRLSNRWRPNTCYLFTEKDAFCRKNKTASSSRILSSLAGKLGNCTVHSLLSILLWLAVKV